LTEGRRLRTRIYIDGYNFYYGCLKHTNYKWLNPSLLFDQILKTIRIDIEGIPAQFDFPAPHIKFYTAQILPKFAKAADSVKCQSDYHMALKAQLNDSIEGNYNAIQARAHRFEKGVKPKDSEKIDIWKLEEKKSDVAIAISAYGDALRGEIDQVVFVSNDTDLVPALKAIKQYTKAKIGLIIPTRNHERPITAELDSLSDWTRGSIRDEELNAAHLPTPLRVSKNRMVHKPVLCDFLT